MLRDDLVFDGFSNLAGGVDGGRSADLISGNQCAEAQNVVFRGGIPTTRPGFADLTHNFVDQHYYFLSGVYDGGSPPGGSSISSTTAFRNRRFQGASYFSPPGQLETIMANIGGRLFQMTPKEGSIDIREIKLGRRNTTDRDISYMVQADRFHITQDGQSKAIIFDGIQARRAGEDEVITGKQMAYGMGRLVVIRDQDIYFGDLYGSHPDGSPGDSVLKFTETTFLNEGGPAGISSSLGKITACFFTPQQDSSTGDGELLVSAQRGVVSFFVSQPREIWKESAFQRIALQNVGVRGHRSPVSKNGDVWFRADDGCRSYRQARAEINGWAHLPMSTNVRKWVENDSDQLLDYASAIPFDNRIIFTCSPTPNQGRLYHAGLLSLDFDVLSAFGESSNPAWDGHWSKLKVTQLVEGMFKGTHRAFAFAIDDNNQNHVYELTRNERRDFDGPISSELIGRSMTFSSDQGSGQPFNEKKINGADLWIDNVTDPVTFEVAYRPDQHPDFAEWTTTQTISPVGVCGAITCGGCPTVRKNFKPRLRLPKPPGELDCAFTKRSMLRCYEFQPRIRWTGHASVRRFRVSAHPEIEAIRGEC